MKKYFQVPWSLKDLIVILSTVIVLIFTLILGIYFSGIDKYIGESPQKTFLLIGLFLVQSLIFLLPLLLITRKKYHLNLAQFGLEKMKVFQVIGEAIKGYFLYLLITYLIVVFIIFTNVKIPGYQLQQSVFELFGTKNIELVFAGIIVILIGPIIEEIFFRGFFLRTLSNKIGLIWSSIVTAALFAISHTQWQTIIPVFILGLIINQLVIKNKSIWPAIVFHVINNAIAFLVQILIIKDIIQIEKMI